MEVYRTEQDQIEAIKKFLNTHGTNFLIAVALCVAVFFGYHYWMGQQQASAEQASAAYNELRELMEGGEALDEKARSQFDATYAQLMDAHAKSIYASYASLLKAKLHVEGKELDKAAQTLQWVVDAAATPEIVALANLRLARVAFAQNDNEKALKLLEAESAPFSAAYEELRGDIYVDLGQKDQALQAYKKAMELKTEEAGFSNRILEMKIDSLSPADSGKLTTLGTAAEQVTAPDATVTE